MGGEGEKFEFLQLQSISVEKEERTMKQNQNIEEGKQKVEEVRS